MKSVIVLCFVVRYFMSVERLFLALPRGCLQFVIVVFPDHTHLLFFMQEVVVVDIAKGFQLCLTIPSLMKV